MRNDFEPDKYSGEHDYYIRKRKERNNSKTNFKYLIIGFILGALVLSGYFFSQGLFVNTGTTKEKIEITDPANLNVVSAVAENTLESVVGITTIEVKRDIFLRPIQSAGVGSGVVVDPRGYIITNSHVIAGGNASEVKVLFEDGDEVEGEVLWHDIALDLAIVKVEKDGLVAVPMGDSDKLIIGEIAIAIGNPLGLDFQRTVTSGIISGLHRTIQMENMIMENLIQTDASINRGNSGGPLLNAQGEIIGINTVKVSQAEGLGFSVPINTIKGILDQLINEGDYEQVQLGIIPISASQLKNEYGNIDGVVVGEIFEGPAYNAGIRVSDIIKYIQDNPIKNSTELRKELYKYRPGDKVKLGIIRDGKEMELEVKF